MLRIFIFCLIVSIFISCDLSQQTPTNEVIRERLLLGEFDAYEYLPTVHCDSLVLDTLNNLTYQDSLFSGICFVNFENSSSKQQIQQIFRGKLHGNSLLLSPKGDTISMRLYNHGRFTRELVAGYTTVICDSLDVFQNDLGNQVVFFDGLPFTGKCVSYFDPIESDDSLLQIEKIKPYARGVLEGEVILYNSEGEEVNRKMYKGGELLLP